MSDALLKIEHLTRYFDVSKPWLNRVLEREDKQFLTAVADVSFEIKRGETFALVGESGSGKSTIAKMVVGLLGASEGTIDFDGHRMTGTAGAEMRDLRRRFQMIFQDPFASLNPRWRVGDIIAEPIHTFGLLKGADVSNRVGALLDTVGLSAKDAEKFLHEFSGGQRQRIAIARALSSKPEFIVCDEPTSALDVSVQANRIGVLYLGRLVEVADGKRLFTDPQHPYTRMLLDAVPDLALSGRRRKPVEGEIPNPINPPPGCAFHPRCPLAMPRCRVDAPVPVQTATGYAACFALDKQTA